MPTWHCKQACAPLAGASSMSPQLACRTGLAGQSTSGVRACMHAAALQAYRGMLQAVTQNNQYTHTYIHTYIHARILRYIHTHIHEMCMYMQHWKHTGMLPAVTQRARVRRAWSLACVALLSICGKGRLLPGPGVGAPHGGWAEVWQHSCTWSHMTTGPSTDGAAQLQVFTHDKEAKS